MGRFNERTHVGDLRFDGVVLDKWLAKGLAFTGIGVCVLDADARETQSGGGEERRSGLKFDMMSLKPSFSLPMRLEMGTSTSSNVMKVEPGTH